MCDAPSDLTEDFSLPSALVSEGASDTVCDTASRFPPGVKTSGAHAQRRTWLGLSRECHFDASAELRERTQYGTRCVVSRLQVSQTRGNKVIHHDALIMTPQQRAALHVMRQLDSVGARAGLNCWLRTHRRRRRRRC